MTQCSIAIKGLVCCAAGRCILEIPSLEIQPGERVAIVGHNGAGKSTLFRVLTGFMPVHFGQVEVLGHALHAQTQASTLRGLRQEVGQVLQGLHLIGRLSALDNVLIGSLHRVTAWRSWTRRFPAQEIAKAQEALRKVGLLARQDTRADQLSGGERQKVAIARMLLQEAPLILADEPTAALDPTAAAQACRLLASAAQNASLLTIVHNTSLLPLLADRVIGLQRGRLHFDLPLAAVDDRTLMELYRPAGASEASHWQLAFGPSHFVSDEKLQ